MTTQAFSTRLDRVQWVSIPSHRDGRGVLTAVESGVDVPFEIKRVYFVHDIVADRGGHAHRDTYQIVAAISGGCDLVLSDGRRERVMTLEDPTQAVFLVPMVFIRMRNFAASTVVLVLASTHYDKTRSIYSWEEYLQEIDE